MPQVETPVSTADQVSTEEFQATISECLSVVDRVMDHLDHYSDVFDGEEYADARQVKVETTKAVAYLNSLNAIEGLIRGLGRQR